MSSQHKHRPRKRFGQNFLQDEAVIDRIASAIRPLQEEHLVEIGPGHGALTEALVRSGCRLDVIELDRDLVPGLLAAFCIYPRFRLHSEDALGFDFASLSAAGERLRVAGNLPYNISTPLLFHLLEQAACIEDMHFMLQKEVVERLAAAPGSGDYGRLSVMVQYRCRVEPLFTIRPGAFQPAPKVDSAFVRLVPHSSAPVQVDDEGCLQTVVSRAFGQRRKTLRNTLKGVLSGSQIEACGIDPSVRPERLSLKEFAALSNQLSAAQGSGTEDY